jgi:hypothetical protein
MQAQAANVAAADLQLEHLNNPDAARQLYAQVSAQKGALGQDAAYGVAESYRKRGDLTRERAALESFVAEYSDSPQRQMALRRLEALRQLETGQRSKVQPNSQARPAAKP